MSRPAAGVLESKPQGTARFDHGSRYQRIKLSLGFLTNLKGTRITGASQAAAVFRPEALVLEATPRGTARFDHARSRYQRIRLSLCVLRNPKGTRVTGASRAAITSRPAARVLEAKPQGTARFDHGSRCQEPSVFQKPHGHTNDSCELRLSLPRQASKPTQATPKQHIVLKGPWG